MRSHLSAAAALTDGFPPGVIAREMSKQTVRQQPQPSAVSINKLFPAAATAADVGAKAKTEENWGKI